MVPSPQSVEANPWDDEPTVISTSLPLMASVHSDVAPRRQSSAHVGLAAPSRKRAASAALPLTAARHNAPPVRHAVARPPAVQRVWENLELTQLLRDPSAWLANPQRALLVLALLASTAALTLLWLVRSSG